MSSAPSTGQNRSPLYANLTPDDQEVLRYASVLTEFNGPEPLGPHEVSAFLQWEFGKRWTIDYYQRQVLPTRSAIVSKRGESAWQEMVKDFIRGSALDIKEKIDEVNVAYKRFRNGDDNETDSFKDMERHSTNRSETDSGPASRNDWEPAYERQEDAQERFYNNDLKRYPDPTFAFHHGTSMNTPDHVLKYWEQKEKMNRGG
ncbi:MAG: hypothetical protein Q9170_002039 [Blastenia crenularia]